MKEAAQPTTANISKAGSGVPRCHQLHFSSAEQAMLKPSTLPLAKKTWNAGSQIKALCRQPPVDAVSPTLLSRQPAPLPAPRIPQHLCASSLAPRINSTSQPRLIWHAPGFNTLCTDYRPDLNGRAAGSLACLCGRVSAVSGHTIHPTETSRMRREAERETAGSGRGDGYTAQKPLGSTSLVFAIACTRRRWCSPSSDP